MGDTSKANVELFSADSTVQARLLEQGGNAASAQLQAWAPAPTAFDTNGANTMDIAENETPTRPVTLSQIIAEDSDSQAFDHGVNSKAKTPSRRPVERVRGQSICSVCDTDLTGIDRWRRLNHFNRCWSRFCNANVSKKTEVNRPAESDAHTSICLLCKKDLNNLATMDAFEHRVLCFRNQKSIPTTCPKCSISFFANCVSRSLVKIAEHLYDCSVRPEDETFNVAQDTWLKRNDERKNTMNCPFCSKSLRDLDAIDALYHRKICLERTRPAYCPICFERLPCFSPRSSLEDHLWHVRNCQHEDSLSVADRFNQDKLALCASGRVRLIYSLFGLHILHKYTTGPRKGWGHKQHSHSYCNKRKAGKKIDLGLYLTPNSNLRTFVTYAGDDGIMLVEKVPSIRAVWNKLAIFRRSAYCVYGTPKHGRIFMGFRSEIEKYGVVHNWHEEMEMESASTTSASSSSATSRTVVTLSCEGRRLCAVETARRTGIRVPPGFDSGAGESGKKLSGELNSDSGLATCEGHAEGDIEKPSCSTDEPQDHHKSVENVDQNSV
ncbi:uncharacterized protein M421DRAFT_92897 [Didymella exigua CBS 183.55]|uniref:Uncharacterized protein n=1 Tax=Didymella exigua CBS 183.55 TaxID=1150837 RepID=A0A6A5RIC4_9PLEO|nr:uncharacterized protein M421DRAFT_92897 [Didymella exigua CBS 183.55]KAF1928095.1 hypothetical protein M421DRAFT_92897 [Didymella exigua CBS 183.55]